jgi:O-antigen/teichoic acid export membrane protein
VSSFINWVLVNIRKKGFKKYSKNTFWIFLQKILRVISGLLVGLWVVRYLGPERFGILSYSQSLVALFLSISALGLGEEILVKEILNSKKSISIIIGTSISLRIIGAITMILILIGYMFFSNNEIFINTIIIIIAASSIFESFTSNINYYFQSKVENKILLKADILSLLISAFLKILLILNGASLIYFALIILIDSMILASILLYSFFKNSKSNLSDLSFDKKLSYKLINSSWPLIFGGMLTSIYMKIDQVMIKELIGTEEVGVYAVAIKLTELCYILPGVITSSLLPAIINSKKINENLYIKRLQSLYGFLLFIAIFISLIMNFFSEFIIKIFFGNEYLSSIQILKIYAWNSIFVFIGIVSSKWLIIENLQVYLTINVFFGAIINVILNYLLIDKIGLVGAAWASLISQFVSSYLMLLFWNKTRPNFKYITFSPLKMLKLNDK